MRGRCAIGLLLLAVSAVSAATHEFTAIPSGTFQSVLPITENRNTITVSRFALATQPVTNQEFLRFVRQHPRWRRGKASPLFVGKNYLSHWRAPLTPGETVVPNAPVTQVSWFAAQAFCESQDARLPTWYEWEYVAAASEMRRDARNSAAWRQRILAWYAVSNPEHWPVVGRGKPNAYGVWDMHGLVWEWVLDFNAMLVSADSRKQNGANKLKFCGAGALAVENKKNYATLMRIAFLSSLQADYTTANLGFRCAHDLPKQTPMRAMR